MKTVLTKYFALILMISLLVACVTTVVSAEDSSYQPQSSVEEAIAQAGSATGGSIATNRIYFQMPRTDSWYSEYGVYHNRYHAGIFWWSGSVQPQAYPEIINIEEAYAGDYDTLPEGSPNQDNMDGCIFIVDPDPEIITSQYIPNRPYVGDWYVYYGDGCYGSYATTSGNFISRDENCLNPDHFDEGGNHIGGDHIKAPDVPDDQLVYGDADCDGAVTILDATVIQRVLIEYPQDDFSEKAADVDGKGLDVTDATRIQRFTAGMIDHFPIENAPV